MSHDRNRIPQPDQDTALEALFADLRAQPLDLPAGLMARVAQDADTWQPQPAAALRAPARRGLVMRLRQAFGPRALGGLVCAGLVGLGLGFVMPETVDLGFGLSASAQTVELYPADFEAWTEALDADLSASE